MVEKRRCGDLFVNLVVRAPRLGPVLSDLRFGFGLSRCAMSFTTIQHSLILNVMVPSPQML